MSSIVHPVFFTVTMFVACGATSQEPCTQADANAIDLWYHAELDEHCAGQGKNCAARPRIEAEYDRRYDEWVRCTGEEDPR